MFKNLFNTIVSNIQLISNVAVLLGLVWAIVQFYISQHTKSVCKAIELTLFYKSNVLDVFPIINYVYKQCELNTLLSKVDFTKVVYFNTPELYIFFTRADIEKFTNYVDRSDFNEILISVCNLFPFTFDGIDITKDATIKEISISCEVIKTKQSYMMLLSNIMNNLEYFSTSFNKNIANKKSVYQVVHQSFIRTVELLYAEISLHNEIEDESKYYTNVIKLYKTWKKEALRKQHKIDKTKNKYSNKISSIIK